MGDFGDGGGASALLELYSNALPLQVMERNDISLLLGCSNFTYLLRCIPHLD